MLNLLVLLSALLSPLLGALVAAHAQTDLTKFHTFRNRLWNEHGLVGPKYSLKESADWGFGYFNATSAVGGPTEIRSFVLFTIASPATTPKVLPALLSSLFSLGGQPSAQQTNPFGKWTMLTEHLIVGTTNSEAQAACLDRALQGKYLHKCYDLDHEYNLELQDVATLSKSKLHAHTVAVSRIKALVDIVSLGYDVLYFDPHHIFFQNPLQYLYTYTRAHLVVSPTPASKCKKLVIPPGGQLPEDHHKLDLIFMRSGSGTFRCLYNWIYHVTRNDASVDDRPLDHFTFRRVMQECMNALGPELLAVEYLDPTAFPADCHTQCGCANDAPAAALPNGDCSREVMDKWVGFLFSCAGNSTNLFQSMSRYASMYTNATGKPAGL
ncbi:hypothetical protein HYH03_003429 [Edaphochlamys debaryana]|uniref:Nucleotide-diphospho-sugar transferase domain-containing protein n=1 Tax=Edaphochlamys debaryana TaxID=47281 RepID=A0A835YBJ1_9CHLO|nr:hypothetical protein HYH03_003429 [Edaphochlamys debaryana]|eukprot:KAG2498689.1 hypothetical protein HYH03_003429 [Edaphochlamys debaryana]